MKPKQNVVIIRNTDLREAVVNASNPGFKTIHIFHAVPSCFVNEKLII
ncbi:MAG: hypothetical protein WEA56_15655 [Balneolaceae bacterium]